VNSYFLLNAIFEFGNLGIVCFDHMASSRSQTNNILVQSAYSIIKIPSIYLGAVLLHFGELNYLNA
jgi:hypothetical protein